MSREPTHETDILPACPCGVPVRVVRLEQARGRQAGTYHFKGCKATPQELSDMITSEGIRFPWEVQPDSDEATFSEADANVLREMIETKKPRLPEVWALAAAAGYPAPFTKSWFLDREWEWQGDGDITRALNLCLDALAELDDGQTETKSGGKDTSSDRLDEIREEVGLMYGRLYTVQGTAADAMCRLSFKMSEDLLAMVDRWKKHADAADVACDAAHANESDDLRQFSDDLETRLGAAERDGRAKQGLLELAESSLAVVRKNLHHEKQAHQATRSAFRRSHNALCDLVARQHEFIESEKSDEEL